MACNPIFTISQMLKASPGLTDNIGLDLEHQVAYMVENELHHALIKGPDLKIDQGIDVISIDTKSGMLHFWEAKNRARVGVEDLGTFKNIWGELTNKQMKNETVNGDKEIADNYLQNRQDAILGDKRSTGLMSQFPENSPIRDIIQDALDHNRVVFHLIGEANKTKFSKELYKMAMNSPSTHWY